MNRLSKLLLMMLFILAPLKAQAWSSTASQSYHRIHELELWVEEYRSEHGKLPSVEQFRDSLLPKDYPLFKEGYPFFDMWNQRIVYEVPGVHGEFDLYSVGENGIDDKGDKDDISNWNGVNDGYYWKQWWPTGRFTLIAALGTAFLILLSQAFRPWRSAVPIAGVVAGIGISLGCYWLMHPGVVPAHNTPLWLAVIVGLLIFLASLSKLLAMSE